MINYRSLLLLLTLALSTAPCFAFFRVVLIGDSIGSGYGLNDEPAFPRLLSQGLRSEYPNLRLINLSQNGLNLANTENQIESLLQYSGRPEIFILEVGGNDFLANAPIDLTQGRITKILRLVNAKYPKAKLVVVGIGYNADDTSPYRIAARTMKATCVDGFAWEAPENKAGRQTDNIHPAGPGHKEIAEALLRQLKSESLQPVDHPSAASTPSSHASP